MVTTKDLEDLFTTDKPPTVEITLFGTKWEFYTEANTYQSLLVSDIRTGRELTDFLESLVVDRQKDAWHAFLATHDLKGEKLPQFIRMLTELIAGRPTKSPPASPNGRSVTTSRRRSTAT